MALTVADLRQAADAARTAMRESEPELNAADRALGDGDTGVTMRRVFEKVAEAAAGAPDDVGAFFRAIGMAAASATGSSLGTLFAVAFLDLGKATGGLTSLPWQDLGGLVARARDTMMARGGAALGDKSVLDAVTAVAGDIASLTAPDQIRERAVTAARAALDAFRPKPCRIGRARMFAEKSIGRDDPGMLAFLRLVEAVAGKDLAGSSPRTKP